MRLQQLVFICLIYFFNVLTRTLFGPLAPLIAQDLHLSPIEVGQTFLWISIGFGVGAFFTQYVSVRYTFSQLIAATGFIVGASGIGMTLIQSAVFLKTIVLCLGFAAGFFLPAAISQINHIVEPNRTGRTFAFFALSQGLGFTLAGVLAKLLSPILGWKNIFLIIGMITLLVSFSYLFICNRIRIKSPKVNKEVVRSIILSPPFWYYIILLSVITGLNVGVFSLASHYFYHLGVSVEASSNYVIAGRALGLPLIFIVGWLCDRISHKKIIFWGLISLGVLTTLIGSISLTYLALLIFAFQSPLSISMMPVIQSGMAKIFPKEHMASIISINSPITFVLGAGIIPQVITIFAEFGHYSLGFILFGIMTILFGISTQFKRVSQHIEPTKEVV